VTPRPNSRKKTLHKRELNECMKCWMDYVFNVQKTIGKLRGKNMETGIVKLMMI